MSRIMRAMTGPTPANRSRSLSLAALLAVFVALLLPGASFAGTNFTGFLSGPAESPPNNSPGTGETIVNYDANTHILVVTANFRGLTGTTTASHIHCCTALPNTSTAGVATQVPTFAGFPLGVTAGTYQASFDLTQAASWNPAFITANGGTPGSAEAALAAGLLANKAYLNIHTSTFAGGEIRAFLTPQLGATLIPTLSPWLLLVLAGLLAGASFWFVRRQRA
jgi:hypothetical protein